MSNTELFSPESLKTIEDHLTAATSRARKLRTEWEQANRLEGIWQKIALFVQREWPFHLLDLMQREVPFLKRLREEQHPAVPLFEDVYIQAKQEVDKLRRRYPLRMEEACSAAGLTLSRESRHPMYFFANGFLKVEIDERKGIARLSDYEGKLAQVPADPTAVLEAVLREQTRLLGRPFDPQAFLSILRDCYLDVIRREGQPDGASIPIREIPRLLEKIAKGFRSDEFLVDLARLVTHGAVSAEGRRLELQHTKDTDQGMLLPGIESQGYVGYILFRGG